MTISRRWSAPSRTFPSRGSSSATSRRCCSTACGLARTVDALAGTVDGPVDLVAAIEARGFAIGGALAVKLGAGLLLIRKDGKLPGATIAEDYALEYGSDRLAMHVDACAPGARVLIVDDLLATGGTALAAARLVQTGRGRDWSAPASSSTCRSWAASRALADAGIDSAKACSRSKAIKARQSASTAGKRFTKPVQPIEFNAHINSMSVGEKSMFAYPLRTAALAAVAASACRAAAYNGLYSGVGVGVGNGYYDPYYGSGYGYGYGAGYPGYGYGSGFNSYWGWNDGFYYPGTGYYVYDRYRRAASLDRCAAPLLERPRRERSAQRADSAEIATNWSDFDGNRDGTRQIQRSVDSPVRVRSSVERPVKVERSQRVERSSTRSERSSARSERRASERPQRPFEPPRRPSAGLGSRRPLRAA